MSNKDQDKGKWEKFAEDQPESALEDTEQELIEDDAAEGITFPSREELEKQLTAMEMKVDEYKNVSLRAQAELENTRRRAERDVSNAHKFGNEKLINELLPIIDSMEHGLETPDDDNAHAKSMKEGMQLTLGLLIKTLEKFGVVMINPEAGVGFDPEQHEAISMQPNADLGPNKILQVVQKGYSLNGRVLRAARVVVTQ